MRLLPFAFLILIASLLAASQDRLIGKLDNKGKHQPVLLLDDGRVIRLEGDRDTMAVLKDQRLHGELMEVVGTFDAQNHTFHIGPFHKKSFFVIKNGKRFTVYYWCDLCSIRSYTPGDCECCQQPTELRFEEVSDQ